ncbi:low-density lipoprotein receptor-related protein-like [Saccoglossus kowalevskii]
MHHFIVASIPGGYENDCFRDFMYQCGDEDCISIYEVCNGIPDCANGEDEVNCPDCRPPMEKCKNSSRCFGPWERCNGWPICEDFTDELNCECKDDQFQCTNGRCIDESHSVCNHYDDCGDNSDEDNCGKIDCDLRC